MAYFDIDATTVWKKNRVIEVGTTTDSGATRLVFDVAEIIDTLGEGGTFSLLVSSGDTTYASTVTLDSKKLYWVVDDTTLSTYGIKTIQYKYTLNSQVKSWKKMLIKVSSSLAVTEED